MRIERFSGRGAFYVPSDWSYFWLFILLAFVCLVISALLAKVKIRSFPLNPIYWHYWVVAKASTPILNGEKFHPKFLRAYMFFLIGSICFLVQALFVFVIILVVGKNA